jgi:hypothetical protein
MKIAVLLVGSILLTACSRNPDSYAPPTQRKPFELKSEGKLQYYITMGMPEAPLHFVDGWVPQLEQNAWRWVLQKSSTRFQLPTTRGLKLFVDLTIPDLILQQTGPVNISYFVSGHLLDKVRYDKAGQSNFTKAVPEEWLTTKEPVVVRLEIDKLWKSPIDGLERGFIVSRIGFQQ